MDTSRLYHAPFQPLLEIPQLELEAKHSSRHHNLGGHGGDLQQTLHVPFLAMDPPSFPPVTLAASCSTMVLIFTSRLPALAKLLLPDVTTEDELAAREALKVISQARQNAVGADPVERHLGGVLVARATRGGVFSPFLMALASTAATMEAAVWRSVRNSAKVGHAPPSSAKSASSKRASLATLTPPA